MSSRDKSDYARKVHEKAVIEKRQMAVEKRANEARESRESAEAAQEVRVLTLNHGEHQDATLYRFEKGCVLRFSPDPSLLGRKVFLYTNYVVNDTHEKGEQAEFVRNQYYGLEWRMGGEEEESEAGGTGGEVLGSGLLLTDTDAYCSLRLARAGCFHYYFVYDNAESRLGPQGSGWFHVAPTLRAGSRVLTPDALMCQTVLAKCLGPLSRWERALRPAKEAGYNLLHFTPIQELGASNSSYSIANQLRLDPRYSGDGAREHTFADVEHLVTKIRNEWHMLSICDVVLNHTANETPWLAEHPEATYNCLNCPYLRPAAMLDAVLARLAADLAPRRLTQLDHLEGVIHILEKQRLPEARLHELFTCNVDDIVQQFCCMARNKVPAVRAEGPGAGEVGEGELQLQPDPQYRRLHATVDMDLALRLYNVYRADCFDEESRLKRCCEELARRLEQLNAAASNELQDHLRSALNNCLAAMRYYRLQSDGPKIEEVSEKHPLVPRYFTYPCPVGTLSEMEAVIYSDAGRYVMAHNGWVMDADPLQDFAARAANGRVYLRRELIAWGDSVKLRYGEKPEDSAFLWAHMREYVELTAEVFDGLRLDNCHSTPLHVAEYMLDCARNVKPDLYVVAELFTNSDHVDNIFVNRLGITSLIREALSAWDSHEQGRLLHRFGARAVGSFARAARRLAAPRVAHAMLLDLTHDNPSPVDKRSVFDMLPSAALVAMACCATGSTRGYDELVPHHIHVVDESRLYSEWGEAGAGAGPGAGQGEAQGEGPEGVAVGAGRVHARCGMLSARRVLNALHYQLAAEGYDEVYVDQMDADVVAVTRHEPKSRKSVILVAFTAFSAPEPGFGGRYVKPLRFEGQLDEIVLEANIRHIDYRSTGRPFQPPSAFTKHSQYINGLTEYEVSVEQKVPLAQSQVFSCERREGGHTVLEFRALAPGTVVAVRVSPRAPHAAALAALRRAPDLTPALTDLTLADFNTLLYCCDAEERDRGAGGVYDVPGHGPLVYAGLQGVVSLLDVVGPEDDLGHPLCDNLRAGDWLIEYQWRRLEAEPRLAAVCARYREALLPLTELPRFLVPAYFERAVRALYAAAVRGALARLSGWARGGRVVRELALCSVQLCAAVRSALLPAVREQASLSAGLPHFAVGYMRCWGRDTFIALRGLFLLTGRYQEAKAHILSFGACLRHGLIPNLLDGGRNARYNCRDAVWWWLQSIKQYCCEVPGGGALLAEGVARMYPRDDCEPAPPGSADQPLHDVMQEALDVHFQGLVFRERNAGRAIDAHMSDKGFNVQIGIDPETGFPFGGNDANCGTWMDKMGSSEAAGTRGKPATPRDGSAVELVALAYSVASWLAAQHRAARFPYPGVARRHRDGSLTAWTYAQWAERIRHNFERYFWVSAAPGAADLRPDLVHRRAIYKDTHGATRPWADYQLRCNFSVAMAIAPEIFDPKHAWLALDNVERLLLGPLGVKTLDPADWAYRGDYDNSNNSDDPNIAHGFNYHQGPEWVWPIGYYLLARLAFAKENGKYAKTVAATYATLAPLVAELRSSPWRGLPELTNAGGAYCKDSCRTQAWSAATVLEALREAEALRNARTLTD
ncbi:glycogen debranching enzyme [Papilio machaon]|uniref:glycogen debranching enzyme n=1 Tax=Papilio machaon TaxID=76193 RepID=UPI001E66432A|nr:glycogen debranching enzyme [Papilio machaon]